ncbi:hypothetical protein UFOVP14_48 [uncultured Caudovirales phage]|uniref:Uncharacterized protein n=1 Tax=uncultured Caudovirales phage TaxID=2100421 RepID=A0A6J5KKF0_9CAUD|nr:hypothetical protein UFOVP14_48 [uncultured Caudovirales phage]
MRVPPLFNGKVWIGSAYQRPLPNYMTKDGELIQYALLCNKRPTLANYILRLIGL